MNGTHLGFKIGSQARSWSEPYDGSVNGFCQPKGSPRLSQYSCVNNSEADSMADNHVALWAVARIGSLKASGTTAAHGKPFFLATGLHKPHVRPQAMQQPARTERKESNTEVHNSG